MRVYLYLRNFPPFGNDFNNRYAGLIKSVHGLASGLYAAGADVTILSEALPDEDTVYHSPAGYTIRSYAQPTQHRPTFKVSPNLQQFIKVSITPSDLVILNGILHPTIYALSRILKRKNISYIVAPHDPYTPDFFRRSRHLKLPYWYLLERPMLQQAKAVQVLDMRHRHWIEKLHVKTPVIETPNGFHPEDEHFESVTWQPEAKIKLMFLGRFDAYNKGLDLLIDAVAQLVLSVPMSLTFQGSTGDDRATLEAKVANLGLQQTVSFRDPDYSQSPSQLIQNYDIFCLPSRFEGFSLAALEAMLASRVVLVSEIAGVAPHVLKSDCGVVVKPTIEAIKSGLQTLIERRTEWPTMGAQGHRYVVEQLSWRNIATTALSQYKQLIA
ncbi:MAG: glycosyltransferase [Cyanobacteria bacterium J06607_17]